MSAGNVGGAGSKPPVTTTSEPGKQTEVNEKGKLPGGAEVTKKGGETPVQDGSQPVDTAADKKIDARKTELQPKLMPTVSMDEDGDGEVFMDAVQDTDELAMFSTEDIEELEQAMLKEEDLSFEDALDDAVGVMKQESKVMQRLKKLGDKISSAFRNFANKFKPEPKVAEAMAKGVGQLVDVSSDGLKDAEAEKIADGIAAKLENNPDEVLKDMENTPSLQEVVTDIKDTMRVATKKNLMIMKNKLMESADRFPALDGMSDDARELMLNATLSAAKLGNPGSKKTDITQLESRGYIIGKIPTAKLRLVEAVLKSSPESAITQLKEWLPNTNFATEIDDTLQLQGVPNLFEGDELEVAENPSAVHTSDADENRSAVNTPHTDADPGIRSRESLARRYGVKSDMDAVMNEITPAKASEFRGEAALWDVENLFAEDKLEVDENPKAPQWATAADKRRQARALTEERRQEIMDEQTAKEAKAHGKKIHKELQNNKLFNDIRTKESEQEVLAGYEAAKAELIKQGGLMDEAQTKLEELQGSIEEALIDKGAKDAALLSRGILVANKLAAWTDPASSDEITMLGSTVVKQKYSDTLETAAAMVQEDMDIIRNGLLLNPAVKNSDFQSRQIIDAQEEE